MDLADMDRKIKENHIHTALFCSPHNPTGRVWERWEIEEAMRVFRDNDLAPNSRVVSGAKWVKIMG